MTSTSAQPQIRRILVGYDGSDRSRGAVERACSLSELLGARVDFVRAVSDQRWVAALDEHASWSSVHERTLQHTVAALRELVPQGLAWHSSLDERVVVAPGRTARLLLQQLQRLGSDLLLLGKHRERGPFDFGNTARAVLAHAPCPVWIQPGQPRPVEKVLVPIESEVEGRAVAGLARSLARHVTGAMTLLHAFVPPDVAWAPVSVIDAGFPNYLIDEVRSSERAEFDRFAAELRTEGLTCETLFTEGSATQEILAHQSEHDLIVMGTHGRGRFSKEVLGSVAYGVLRSAEVPVVVVPLDSSLFDREAADGQS